MSLERPRIVRPERPRLGRYYRKKGVLTNRGTFYQFEQALDNTMMYWGIVSCGEIIWEEMFGRQKLDACVNFN